MLSVLNCHGVFRGGTTSSELYAVLITSYSSRSISERAAPAYTDAMASPSGWMLGSCLWLGVASAGAVSPCSTKSPEATSTASAATSTIPYGQGLLFRVERADAPASHIFGTIHLDYPRVTRLPPEVNLTLLHSRRLVLETVIDEEAQQLYSQRMYLPEDRTLAQWLDSELLARYEKLAARYDVPADVAMRLTPWAATNLIGRPKPTTGRTMEDVLREMAIQLGRPVYGLETIDELIEAQEDMPIDDQVTVLEDTICNHRKVMEQTGQLLLLYASGDLSGLVALDEGDHNDEALFQRINERMLYARSAQMVRRLQEHLTAGSALIAVGASHLPGERGILRLLEKQGYTITRKF